MKAAGCEWALLSPEGTYHKLSEPNFFVGREDEMDLTLKSRSVDKQHAVISVNLENAEYKLHDLGTLNGVSMSIPWNATDPIKLEVLESCVLSDSLPCAILLLKPQIGINLQDAQGTQTASVCSSSS
ncbi:unnamed protein product, partial [Porites evermanni]